MKHRILIFLTLIYGWVMTGFAQAMPADPVRISLLTCSAGPEVYALYGHTAIRVQNQQSGQDLVFNYGTFNMADPLFIPKFTLGWMDYELGLMPFDVFYYHYTMDGCDITQQELNLTSAEKNRMLMFLERNYQPQNRGYRYNFLFDNCSTRPRDILENIVDGKISWKADSVIVSYRQLMHQCNDIWPWSKLGIDLCLGADADKVITQRQQEYLPAYLMDHLNHAVIVDSLGRERPVVLHETVLKAQTVQNMSPEFILTPMQCILILLGIVLVICVLELRKKTLYWQVDACLYFVQGVAGLLIFILFFFSVHPTVDSNWQLWVYNPLPLLYLPVMTHKRRMGQSDGYALLKVISLGLFLLAFAFIPQDMPVETAVVALILLIRAGMQLYYDGFTCKRKLA